MIVIARIRLNGKEIHLEVARGLDRFARADSRYVEELVEKATKGHYLIGWDLVEEHAWDHAAA